MIDNSGFLFLFREMFHIKNLKKKNSQYCFITIDKLLLIF